MELDMWLRHQIANDTNLATTLKYGRKVVCSSVMVKIISSCFCLLHSSMFSTRDLLFEFQVYVDSLVCILLRSRASSSKMKEKSAVTNVMKAHRGCYNLISE